MSTPTAGAIAGNRILLEEMYGAAKRGDAETFFSCMSADVVVEEPPYLSHGGTYTGIHAVQELFGTLASTFVLGGLDIDAILTTGDDFCMIARIPLVRDGSIVSFIERGVVRDGKVVFVGVYMHDPGSLLAAA